jgi:histidinol-phosphate aminotransferase
VKKNVRELVPYEAKEIPARVKLDANESPYGLRINAKLLKGISTNRYPDPEAGALRAAYARAIGLRSTEMLLHGNGSDEIIYNLVCTFGGPVLYPTPTFSMYGKIGQALNEKAVEVPLAGDFALDMDAMLRKIKSEKPKLVFLSSPNNPTGNCFAEKDILKILDASAGIVVVDEAYQPFSGRKSFVRLIGKHENLAALRTLSKIGLAALRVGFLAARPEIVREVNRVRLPFNLNSFSQALAEDALEKPARMNSYIRKIVSERKRLFGELSRVEGIEPFPSEANFMLFRVKEPSEVYRRMLSLGVLVRDLSGAVPGCLRVTVGTGKENDRFLKSIKRAIR